MVNRARLIGVLLALSLMGGCVSSQVEIKRSYNFGAVKRVAVLNFNDSLGYPNSGSLVADVFAQKMLRLDYDIVERAELEKVLREQELSISGVTDPAHLVRIGKIFGVNAIIVGSVHKFEEQRKEFVAVTRTTEGSATGGIVERTMPEVTVYPAAVSISCRMIDVETAEVVWIASGDYEGLTPYVATDYLVSSIVKKLEKFIKSRPPLTRI